MTTSGIDKEFELENNIKIDKNNKNKFFEIHLNKKSYKIDSNNNVDCSKNIKYLNGLIERNELCIQKFINTEDEKKNDEIIEENKINIDLSHKQQSNDKKKQFFNSKGISPN